MGHSGLAVETTDYNNCYTFTNKIQDGSQWSCCRDYCRGEATNTNFIVIGLTTRSGLEPMIYHNRGKHSNHYITDVVGYPVPYW
jgi:uncharacterized protein (DUF849 family)